MSKFVKAIKIYFYWAYYLRKMYEPYLMTLKYCRLDIISGCLVTIVQNYILYNRIEYTCTENCNCIAQVY